MVLFQTKDKKSFKSNSKQMIEFDNWVFFNEKRVIINNNSETYI